MQNENLFLSLVTGSASSLLYYRLTPQNFLFGSEIKVLLAYPGVRPDFNRAALPEFLAFGYLSGDETFYSGVHKLMPGHRLEIDEQGRSARRAVLGLAAGFRGQTAR